MARSVIFLKEGFDLATKADKEQRVQELKEFVSGAELWMVSDYRGLSVQAFADLRTKLREQDAHITVAKNTLYRRVLEDVGPSDAIKLLSGPSAVTASHGDVAAAAKILWDLYQDDDSFVIRGGVLEGDVVGVDVIARLSSLPSREDLLGQAVGAIGSPLSGIVFVLDSLLAGLVYSLQGRLEQIEGSSAE
jgi:large subunit ribosomal protein L10